MTVDTTMKTPPTASTKPADTSSSRAAQMTTRLSKMLSTKSGWEAVGRGPGKSATQSHAVAATTSTAARTTPIARTVESLPFWSGVGAFSLLDASFVTSSSLDVDQVERN